MSVVLAYSGGFDPLHRHHIERIQWAGALGHLHVIVEPDEFVEHKHPVLMKQEDRAAIISRIDGVFSVHIATQGVNTSRILGHIKPDFYVIGPDHIPDQIAEYAVCNELGIGILTAPRLNEDALSSTGILESYFDRTLKLRYKDLKIKGMLPEQRRNAIPEQTAQKYVNPPVTVSCLIHNKEGRVLIGDRKEGTWDLPGGFLEVGETLEGACVRECQEELNRFYPTKRLSYYGSMVGKYVDGRDILAVYFTYDFDRPIELLQGAGEYESLEFVSRAPKGKCFSEMDRAVLDHWFLQDTR